MGMFYVARSFGRMLGYGLRPTYREYVPDHLVGVMESKDGRFKSQ